ncbi:hypothetical protein A33I_08745 [Alkalihalophilus marmarensis DSM 21297]|uniref:Uncharacterized protein n=1 Tax=Alkalihalophilus marmarensis DSM 21297 TaxID=1188261 RepID=U6SR09_9BACI|nr:hypothetical protein A33I_08745 [Alkalihalophilus marmarensis DSM 21297]
MFFTILYSFIGILSFKEYRKRSPEEKKEFVSDLKQPRVITFVIGSAIAYAGFIIRSPYAVISGFFFVLISFMIMTHNRKQPKEALKWFLLSVLICIYLLFYFYLTFL